MDYMLLITKSWHCGSILTVIYHLNLLSEPMSDQSDIESRIRALKEELRKRKSMAYQLKKEQKKRHKERLKAQEASLLKQLEVRVFVACWLFGLGMIDCSQPHAHMCVYV